MLVHKKTFAFALSAVVPLVACSSTAELPAAMDESALVADVKTITKRPDGKFDVVCNARAGGGTYEEVVTPSDLAAGRVCSASTGGNCGGALARFHTDWSPTQLQWACAGADATCVDDLAHFHTDWSPTQLNSACKDNNGNCGGALARFHTDWSPTQLQWACEGADASCVVDLAHFHTDWSPTQLHSACER
ncbi:MAG TPA: hypothetical protein VM925_11845 [Labilithrix sp.]|nr:hypothetical protein [Labilithrix sp.]